MKYAVVRHDGHVAAMFEDQDEARAYAERHGRSITVYTRSGRRQEWDLHAIALDRLEHYRRQLAEAVA